MVEVAGASKRWGSAPPVLDRIDLEVKPGQAVRISGSNGVGKTTLLRAVAGILDLDAGTISVEGVESGRDRLAYQAKIAFLPAGDRGLYARLSPVRHLDLWARFGLLAPEERVRRVAGAVERFQLGEFAERRVDRLSMGQRQRVRLAGLGLHRPRLVLLDEPQNSLDSAGIELLASFISEVRDEGGAALWCSPAGERALVDFDASLELAGGKLR